MISDYDSVSFFMNGGCLELAKLVKYYFPETKYAMRKDFNHFCSFYDGKLYDAMDYFEEWQIKKYNIDVGNKDISNFKLLEEKEIEELPVEYGVINYINNLEVYKYIISEIEKINSVKVLKKDLIN